MDARDPLPTPTRVLVVSPHEVVRVGLVGVLAEHDDLVVTSTDEPVFSTEDARVALYDVVSLHESTSELERLVKEPCAVLAVARDDLRPDLVGRAAALGVDGCVSTSWPGRRLAAAVRHAARRAQRPGRVLTPTRASHPGGAHPSGLTAREAEVIARITRGMSNEEIAGDLFLSINSVKTYVRTAYRRIGITRRAQAVAWGIQNGFIPPSAEAEAAEAAHRAAARRS